MWLKRAGRGLSCFALLVTKASRTTDWTVRSTSSTLLSTPPKFTDASLPRRLSIANEQQLLQLDHQKQRTAGSQCVVNTEHGHRVEN